MEKEIVGEENILTERPNALGAEDFADYLAVVPGCFIRVGSRSSESTAYPHHHEQFDIDEESLLISTQFHVDVILRQEEFFPSSR